MNSRIHAGGHASPRKVCDENKMKKQRKKKRWLRKSFFDDRKDFVCMAVAEVTDVNELQDNNSSHTEGTICLAN